LRTESIGPAVVLDMRCSTTTTFARGTVSRPPPPRSTRPLTLTDCPASGAPPQSTPSSRAALRRELAEIFRIEVLEVGLQRVGIERAAAGAWRAWVCHGIAGW